MINNIIVLINDNESVYVDDNVFDSFDFKQLQKDRQTISNSVI